MLGVLVLQHQPRSVVVFAQLQDAAQLQYVRDEVDAPPDELDVTPAPFSAEISLAPTAQPNAAPVAFTPVPTRTYYTEQPTLLPTAISSDGSIGDIITSLPPVADTTAPGATPAPPSSLSSPMPVSFVYWPAAPRISVTTGAK